MKLPFLIVHGDVAWIPLLLALTVASLALLNRRRPVSMPIRACVACGVALGWYLMLFALGSFALHVGVKGSGRNLRFAQFSATTVAAAMPGTRDDALSQYGYQLASRFENTEASLQLRAAFIEYGEHCPVDLYIESMRLDDALEVAHRCGSRRQVVEALIRLGRYEEAAAELPPDDHSFIATLVYISTGRWTSAALGAEASAAAERDPLRAAKYQCLGALFRTYGGDRDAFTRIRDQGTGWSCPILEALSLPYDQELDALKAIRRPEETFKESDVVNLAREIAGTHTGGIWAFAGEQAEFNLDRKIWWTPFLEDIGESELGRSSIAAARGDFDVLNGNFERAAMRLASVRVNFLHLQLQNLLDQRTGMMPVVDDDTHLAEWMLLRSGRPLPPDRRRLVMERDDERLAIAAAQAGDGAPLATLLETSDAYPQRDQLLMGLLPLVTTHREELASALHPFHTTTSTLVDFPFGLLSDLANQRDMSTLVGDTVGARATQAIFVRHSEVLSDRRRLIGLRVWTDL